MDFNLGNAAMEVPGATSSASSRRNLERGRDKKRTWLGKKLVSFE